MLGVRKFGETITEWEELKKREKELREEIDRLEGMMKQEMERRGVEELEVGSRTVRWTSYAQNQFDTTGFRKSEPEMWKKWVREVSRRRFSVS